MFSHQSIEGGLRNQTGVHSIKVALLAERGVVEYDPTVWTADKLIGVRRTKHSKRFVGLTVKHITGNQ